MMKDLEVNRKTKECPFTVEFYGALFREGEVLICMEVMDVSLEQYYKAAHRIAIGMPRDILGKHIYLSDCKAGFFSKLNLFSRRDRTRNLMSDH